jgi:phosphatidylserine decarboxylase
MNIGLPVLVAGLATLLMFALAAKWRLPLALSLAVAAAVAVVAAVPFLWIYPLFASTVARAVVALAQMGVSFALGVFLLGLRFVRDPERVSPPEDGLVLSPADGQVIYTRTVATDSTPLVTKLGRDYLITELLGTTLAEEGAYVIGVEMNVLNVHVNRCPIGGQTRLVKHIPGKFISLRRDEAPFINERCTTVIDCDGFVVASVQIASRLVRRIENYLSVGQSVNAGQRLGRIAFGSLVAVVLPKRDDVEIEVQVGDQVTAGVSILARYASPSRETPK